MWRFPILCYPFKQIYLTIIFNGASIFFRCPKSLIYCTSAKIINFLHCSKFMIFILQAQACGFLTIGHPCLYRFIHWTGHRFEPRYPHKSACLSDSFYTYVCVSLTFWLPLCESKALGRVGTAVSRRTCQSRCYPQIGSNPGPRYDAIHT